MHKADSFLKLVIMLLVWSIFFSFLEHGKTIGTVQIPEEKFFLLCITALSTAPLLFKELFSAGFADGISSYQ